MALEAVYFPSLSLHITATVPLFLDRATSPSTLNLRRFLEGGIHLETDRMVFQR